MRAEDGKQGSESIPVRESAFFLVCPIADVREVSCYYRYVPIAA